MTSKKKLKQQIKQLREVVKCERTERLALDRHGESLLTLFNEECARNEKLKAELALYEDRDYDRWESYCHGWENGRGTALASRLTVGHRILSDWTDDEKEELRQKLVSYQSYRALTHHCKVHLEKAETSPRGMPKHHRHPDWKNCDRCRTGTPTTEWNYLSCMCEKCSKDRSRWHCIECGDNLGLTNNLEEGRSWYGIVEYCKRCLSPPQTTEGNGTFMYMPLHDTL